LLLMMLATVALPRVAAGQDPVAMSSWQGGIAIAPADLVRFFAQMGYDPDTLHLEGITPPLVSVEDKIPRARDLPSERIYAAYDRFLDELHQGTDPSHTTARGRFIQRVQRLQEDH
jgi:hypothetical protein